MRKTTLLLFLLIIWALVDIANAQPKYYFSSGTTTYSALSGGSIFSWTEATANDEGYSAATDIGFSFTYNGTAFTQFQVSTNGFLKLGTGLAAATASDSLSGTLRNVLAPLWDDLAVSSTATDITYQLSGVSPNQVLTVEWNKVKWNKTATAANAQFQVKLYESDGHFEFIYGTMSTPTTGSASIGINDATANGKWGTFLSINVGGSGTNFHSSTVYPFNAIATAPASNTILTFTPHTVSALNGSYTVGGSSPDFTTLSQAAQALNINGISGPVVMNVRAGTYDDVIHLINVTGTSATNTITFKKESDAVILSPRNGVRNGSSSTTADFVVALLGTDYSIFDGIDIKHNVNNTTGNAYFEFGYFLSNFNGTDGATHNIIQNATIEGLASSINFRAIRTSGGGFVSVTSSAGAISYNTFQNITAKNNYMSIYLSGASATYPDINNKITALSDYSTGANTTGYNDLGNITISTALASDFRGIYCDYQSNVIIENTEIRNMIASTTTAVSKSQIYGIMLNSGTSIARISGCNIYNNMNLSNNVSDTNNVFGINAAVYSTLQINNCKIYNLKTSASGVGYVRGISAVASGSTLAQIYNNSIYDLRAPYSMGSSVCMVRGLDLQNTTNIYLTNNTVYLDNAEPPSVAGTNVGHSSACVQIGYFGSSNLYMQNNIFVNKTGGAQTGTGYSRVCVIYTGSPAYASHIALGTDNNLYYIDNATKSGYLTRTLLNPGSVGSSYLTLSELKASTNNSIVYAPRDANSISVDATSSFVSSTSPYDLHIKSTDWVVNGQGVPTSLVTTDLDGNARSTSLGNGPVDLGAFEIAPTGDASATVSGTIGDGQTTTFTGVDGKTIATILWSGAAATFPGSVALNYTPGKRPVDNSGTTLSRGIDRMFTFTPDVAGSGWTANVTLYYNPTSEIRNYSETNLHVNQRPLAGTGDWTVYPTTISTATHTAAFTTASLGTFSCDGAPVSGVVFDGTINASEWGSPLTTSDGGPTPGFGAGHEINALYYLPDNTSKDSLYFGIAGNVQNGNRILLFIDSKSGGYNTANFDRTNAPAGLNNFNSATTFDADFYPDYCLVIGTNSTHDNYFYDLFTLSTSGTNKYLGDNTTTGLFGAPANSDITKGFEFRIAKSDLGYTEGAIKVFAAYIGESGYLSNQFLAHANSGEGNYTGGAITFSAAAPNPVTLPASTLPVELTSFTSSVKNNSVLLNWKTATEKSNYGFEVERSSDKVKWSKIAFVSGFGNSNSEKNYSYADKSSMSGKLYYRLKQIDTDGKYEYSNTIEVTLGLPKTYELSNNYPNPFNPSTTIRYAIPESQIVKLTIFNTLGEEVAKVVDGYVEAGVHEVKFNASRLASGIYFYRLEAGKFNEIKKMMLLK